MTENKKSQHTVLNLRTGGTSADHESEGTGIAAPAAERTFYHLIKHYTLTISEKSLVRVI